MQHDTGSPPASGATSADRPGTPAEPSQAVAHLLERAALDAEQWLSEARSEADALVDEARAEAERVVRAGRDEADAVLGEARAEAERVRAELDEAKRRHEADVAQLERLATEHRQHLRQHLIDLLEQVDRQPDGGS
jgi:cell division septum initiation protein DivIVA